MSYPATPHEALWLVHLDGKPVGVNAFNVTGGWVEVFDGDKIVRLSGKVEVKVKP